MSRVVCPSLHWSACLPVLAFVLRFCVWYDPPRSHFFLVLSFNPLLLCPPAPSPALPSLQVWLGQSGTFLLFAGSGAAAWLFILLAVPETKGLSLEEIQAEMQTQTRGGKAW